MTALKIKYYLDKTWSNPKSITGKEIAELIFYMKNPKDSETVISEELEKKVMDKFITLSEKRRVSIAKIYEKMVLQHNKSVESVDNENLILQNLGSYAIYFTVSSSEDDEEIYYEDVNLFKDEQEAAMVIMWINMFIANKNLIDYDNLRDTSHASREKLRLEKQLIEDFCNDVEITEELNSLNKGKKTLKEYTDVCRDFIEKSLINVNNVGQKRANRIATKATKAIRANLKN